MNINETDTLTSLRPKISLPVFSKAEVGHDKFASMLEAERLKAQAVEFRDHIISGQETAADPIANEDIAYIREHGMQAYVIEVQKQKIEEMRAEILAKMGLTEESLSEMPGEQRSAVEQMISDTIQKRMEATSLMNNDTTADNGSYLKTMMMANGSHTFFDGPTSGGTGNLKEHLEQTVKNDPSYAFFRNTAEEK